MRRILIGVGVLLFAFVAVGVVGQVRHARRAAAQKAATDRTIAAHAFELSVSRADYYHRHTLWAQFSVLPTAEPPGLTEIRASPPLAGNSVTDIYVHGDIKAMVNFSNDPGPWPCLGNPCIVDTDIHIEKADAPGTGHVAIWLTGPQSARAEEVQRFWTTTTWDRNENVAWFTEVARRGDAYTRR